MRGKRERLGWSQEELARRVSAATGVVIHQTTITRMEGLTRSIRLGEAVAIAQVLDIDMGVFAPPLSDDVEAEKSVIAALQQLHRARDEQQEAAYRVQVEMEALSTRFERLTAQIEKTHADIQYYDEMLKEIRHSIGKKANGDR